jgi:hypothetical protein
MTCSAVLAVTLVDREEAGQRLLVISERRRRCDVCIVAKASPV